MTEKVLEFSFLIAVATLVKGKVQWSSMQVVMNNCFVLTWKKIGTDLSCCFQKKKLPIKFSAKFTLPNWCSVN